MRRCYIRALFPVCVSAMRRIGRQAVCLLLAAVVAGVVLAGCGQKGPLYQPGSRDQKSSESTASDDKQSVPGSGGSADKSSPHDTGADPTNNDTHNDHS